MTRIEFGRAAFRLSIPAAIAGRTPGRFLRDYAAHPL